MPGGQYNIGINEVWKAEPDVHVVGIFPGVVDELGDYLSMFKAAVNDLGFEVQINKNETPLKI